jgi:hypothetical protein
VSEVGGVRHTRFRPRTQRVQSGVPWCRVVTPPTPRR